jgi:hypothetical protein
MDREPVRPTLDPKTDTEHASTRPAYEPPRVTAMDEAEVLKAFQFTSAGISWWVA